MLANTQSIACAFGLAAAAPRSPYRHLELCGIALEYIYPFSAECFHRGLTQKAMIFLRKLPGKGTGALLCMADFAGTHNGRIYKGAACDPVQCTCESGTSYFPAISSMILRSPCTLLKVGSSKKW